MLEFICPDEQTTAALAVKLASVAQTGDVFALYGTLGMGNLFWQELLFSL